MYNWLMSVIESFDGSDIFAFIGGCLAMVAWKNIQAMKWNRSRKSGGDNSVMGTNTNGTAGEKVRGRKISLPKLNAKYAIYAVIVITIIGTLWGSVSTNRQIRQTAQETVAVAIAVCENAKVNAVERKSLQDFVFGLLNVPPDVAATPPNSEERKQYGQRLGLTYLGALEETQKVRVSLQAGQHFPDGLWQKYFGPDYPEPVCQPSLLQRR